jgi:hypothetical protein
MSRRKILALTTSPLPIRGEITDGPGYRMWNLLHHIAPAHDVRILSLYESFHMGRFGLDPVNQDGMVVERPNFSPGAIASRIRDWSPDIIYLPWSSIPFVGKGNEGIPTIIDYVGPSLLEEFVGGSRVPISLARLQLESFWMGDRFLTTTVRERYYLLGLLAASRRLSTGDFRRDDPLIHVARMTPPSNLPTAVERLPPRTGDELVVLIAGAFLPWYDYEGFEATVRTFVQQHPTRIRFVVMGGNPRSPETTRSVQDRFEHLADRGIVQLVGLVPFDERAKYYLGADVGLLIPPDSVEDELSARTRVVDYLWARLPIVTPGRDEYSSLVLEASAGFRYDSTPEGPMTTLGKLAEDRRPIEAAKARIPSLLEGPFNPKTALVPALEFIENPTVTRRGRRTRVTEGLILEFWEFMRRAQRR